MRIIHLFLFLFCFSIGQAQEQTNIYVKLLGSLKPEMNFNLSARDVRIFPQVDVMRKAELNNMQELNFSIALSAPSTLTLSSGSRKLEFFASPGEDLKILFDIENKDAITVFNGPGAVNAKAHDELQRIESAVFGDYSYTNTTTAASIQLINRSYAAKSAYLKKNKKQLSAEFYKISQVDNYATRLRFLFELPNQLAVYQRKTKAEVIPANYWSFAKQLKLDDKLLISSTYSTLLAYSYPMYLQNKHLYEEGRLGVQLSRAEVVPVRYEELNKKLKKEQLRKIPLAYMLEDYIRSSKAPASLRPVIEEYLASVGDDPSLTKYFNQLYNQYAAISQGQVPPAFTLKKEDGSSLSLADFKGKVVYIDFWASWCGPCRHEMKVGAPALHEAFKDNKDVLFLYISLDEHVDKWKQAIEDDQIQGIHVLSQGGFKSEVAQIFNIKGIPRYMIIDKEGKLFDNDAPRPSMEASQKRIHEALSQ